ncbi:flagellar hook-basal body complex protein [uncultured Roseibium sp.]|uniref:flagellar hook-basal body complex protein n=1 Tax=uncultured Roseibium sp. TaxID=1936171 RepID=UPI003749E8EC
MENAQLIALSRQSALRNQLDVVANNMANINTTGFKSQRMLFEEFIMPVAEATEFQRPDRDLSYVHDYGTLTNFEDGSIKVTGNDLDVAIKGEGFFVVQLADGTEAYTRNGAFHLDNTGRLVTSEGRPVLTEGGPVTFTQQDGKIEIAGDGTISTEQGNRGCHPPGQFRKSAGTRPGRRFAVHRRSPTADDQRKSRPGCHRAIERTGRRGNQPGDRDHARL